MRAVVYDRYGAPDVLRLADVERPLPNEDEVLVKVHVTTVNRSDALIREANRRSGLAASLLSRLVSGPRGPRQRILGSEFAGEVEAVGAAASEFAVGDLVFGTTGLRFGARGSGWSVMSRAGRLDFGALCRTIEGAAPDQETNNDPRSSI